MFTSNLKTGGGSEISNIDLGRVVGTKQAALRISELVDLLGSCVIHVTIVFPSTQTCLAAVL